jgi:predicted nucleic acid-binding protein
VSARYLIDTSALVRLPRAPSVQAVLAPLMAANAAALCTPTLLEAMYAVRTTEYARVLAAYRAAINVLPLTPESCRRAEAVQEELSRKSQHRTAKVVNLLVAACAEVNGLTVLHYDRDFDAIATVTGQPTRWVVPAGSVS